MNDRTKALESIRPLISLEMKGSSPIEVFQNRTLRPILKFQNESLLCLFSNYLLQQKIKIQDFKQKKKEALVYTVLKKNLALKSMLIGSIVGCFTIDELSFYHNYKREINKRIIELLIKRLIDQQEKL